MSARAHASPAKLNFRQDEQDEQDLQEWGFAVSSCKSCSSCQNSKLENEFSPESSCILRLIETVSPQAYCKPLIAKHLTE